MNLRPGLVPTTIVDKRGRQTTVHRKAVDGSSSASKGFPAPVQQKSGVQQRAELEHRVSKLFPEKYEKYIKDKVAELSDESVNIIGECAQKIIANPRMNADLVTFAAMISESKLLDFPESFYPFLLKGIDSLTDDFALASLNDVYRKSLTTDKTPASDETLEAHLYAGTHYFDMAIKSDNRIAFKYLSNEPLFDFVARHPDKVEVILQHYVTYYPEKNGFEDFERDLDRLSELSKPIGEGWL